MRRQDGGFTLLELLISMTLIAVIVVMISMALRTGLRAWIRGKEINTGLILRSSVEGLLGRQLRAVVKGGDPTFSLFEGTQTEVAFVTTYVPMGAQEGGYLEVLYRFDPASETLLYAQKVLTRKDDIDIELPSDTGPGAADVFEQAGWEVSLVQDCPPMIFAFETTDQPLTDPGAWSQTWDQQGAFPDAVAVGWVPADSGKVEEKDILWSRFYLAPFPSLSVSAGQPPGEPPRRTGTAVPLPTGGRR